MGQMTTETKIQYVAPKSDRQGLTIAAIICTLFALFWYHALFEIDLTLKNQCCNYYKIFQNKP